MSYRLIMRLTTGIVLLAMMLSACSSSQQQQEEIEFADENDNQENEEINNYHTNSQAVADNGYDEGVNIAEENSPVNNDLQDLEASLLDPEPAIESVPVQSAVAELVPENIAPTVENIAVDNALAVENAAQSAAPAETVTAPKVQELYPANATLTWVGYEYDTAASQVRVQMVTKGKPQFTIFQEMNKAQQPELVVRFYETAIRRRMRRDIDASEFRSPVAYVRMRDFNETQDVDVVLTLRDAVQPRMVTKDGSVMLTFVIPERYNGPKPIPGQPIARAENLAMANVMPLIEAGSDQLVQKRPSVYNPNPAARVFRDAPADGGGILPAMDTNPPEAMLPEALPDLPSDEIPEVMPMEGVMRSLPHGIKVVGTFGFLQVAQDVGVDAAPTEYVGQDSADPTQVFNGKRISLDFEGTPLAFVLKALADGSEMNFLIDPAASSTLVSMKLTDVPWDQALKAILETYALGMAQVGDNVIRVSRLEQMNEYLGHTRSARRIKSQATPTSILILRLNYALTTEMQPHIQRLLQAEGDDRFSVNSDARTNSLIVEATPHVLGRVKTMIERLDYRTPQVEIVARIVEVSKNLGNFMGVAWGTGFNYDQGRGLGFGSLPYPNALGSTFSVDPGVSASPKVGNTSIQIGSINGLFDIDMLLRIEEQKGVAEILQSTKNIVLDRQRANIAGGSRDVFIPSASPVQITPANAAGGGGTGSQAITVENMLTTQVTPMVLADGNIQLALDISSQLPTPITPGSSAAASQASRTMNTNLIVKSGSTVVIGGIHSATKNEGMQGIPVLMDLPIIGVLFRAKTRAESQTEMLAMITPTILTPSATSSGSDTAGAASASSLLNSAPSNEMPLQNAGQGTSNFNNQGNNSVNEWNNGGQANNSQGIGNNENDTEAM